MEYKILAILLSIFYLLLSFDSASAIGVGASPSSLDVNAQSGQLKIVKILVQNIAQEPGMFQVFPDELREWFIIEPSDFRLEAGESKEVKIKLAAKGEGKKAVNISITSTSLDRQGFSVGPGLKIPLRMDIKGDKRFFLASISEFLNRWALLTVGILAFCMILFSIITRYFKEKRAKSINPPNNLPVGR